MELLPVILLLVIFWMIEISNRRHAEHMAKFWEDQDAQTRRQLAEAMAQTDRALAGWNAALDGSNAVALAAASRKEPTP